MNKIKYPDSYITWDLETTGLHNAGIVQIGITDNQGNILLSELVNPEKEVEIAKALKKILGTIYEYC